MSEHERERLDGETHTGQDDGDRPDPAGGGALAPLPDADQLEEALEAGGDTDLEPATTGGRSGGPRVAGDGPQVARDGREGTRVLEFTLGDDRYCLEVEYVEEIVKDETVTRVPNTAEFVEGVVDLRGQITTILNPKVALGKDAATGDGPIVVFDPDAVEDGGHLGWVVDDVRQVTEVSREDVRDAPVEGEHITGIVDREDDEEFVIWTTPEMATGAK